MAIHITIAVERVDRFDIFRSVTVTGHQQLTDGSLGLLCASVSFLFRTIANSLVNISDIDVKLSYQQRGMLTIDIRSYSVDTVPTLSIMHNLVLQGIHDLRHDYPDQLSYETIPHQA